MVRDDGRPNADLRADGNKVAASVMTDAGSPVPLYYQVFGVLRQRMIDGVYPPGHRLVSEDELAAEFGVSRATVRQAVGELVREGVVSRQQGRGTFVNASVAHSLGLRFRGSLRDLISETTRAGILRVEVQRDAPVQQRIAEALGLEVPRATVVRRTRTMDHRPFAYTVNHLPPPLNDLISEKELKRVGMMTLLEQKGIVFGGATQSIRAQLADVQVSRALDVEFGAPVLFVERLLLKKDGQPCEFVQSWYRGDIYEFRVHLDIVGDVRDLRSHLA
jgi:GntR family transcriptional regulator